ncbi:hypothetical protein J3R30DRAFT_1735652 [Lentinula aciculospora]|uniref:Uncharacterized protein n=1 Tax=Lentinula aciculospora TaxID=153920 RepID=A0A9W8ZWY9_9AGAR|nr:hypothetical protein J3R30DRAFT_1735652 [Lentinula aciculospora]
MVNVTFNCGQVLWRATSCEAVQCGRDVELCLCVLCGQDGSFESCVLQLCYSEMFSRVEFGVAGAGYCSSGYSVGSCADSAESYITIIAFSSIYVRDDESIEFLQIALLCFPNLFKFSVYNSGHIEPGKTKFGLNEDCQAVRIRGEQCPTLNICIVQNAGYSSNTRDDRRANRTNETNVNLSGSKTLR